LKPGVFVGDAPMENLSRPSPPDVRPDFTLSRPPQTFRESWALSFHIYRPRKSRLDAMGKP